MLNKKKTAIVACLFSILCTGVVAQPIHVEQADINVEMLSARVNDLEQENKKLWIQRNIQKKQIKNLTNRLEAAEDKMDHLLKKADGLPTVNRVETNRESILHLDKVISDMKLRLEETQGQVSSIPRRLEQVESGLSVKTQDMDGRIDANQAVVLRLVAIAFGCLFLLLIVGGVGLYRYMNKRIAALQMLTEEVSSKAQVWNEKLLEQLNQELSKLEGFLKLLNQPNVAGDSVKTDHTLVKALVDRITFMQMTLFKMDSSIRGHRQLSKAIRQMIDTLMVSGYEVVDMLGQPYHEGMKAIVNFVDDETLK